MEEIKRTLQTIGNNTFIKYYYQLKESINNPKFDFLELFKKENWRESSYSPKIKSGQKIFINNWNKIALEIILSSRSDEQTLNEAFDIFKREFPNQELKTIRFIRPEFVFGEQIIEKLFNGYQIIKQFKVSKYVVDWYIPELNIVIEFDEKHHNKNLKVDLKRQNEIEKKLKCKFLRYKY